MALAGSRIATRGVDSQQRAEDAHLAARDIARQYQTVVAVTGVEDFVTEGRLSVRIANGHPMMARITGTGCAASAITGAFCGVKRILRCGRSGPRDLRNRGRTRRAVKSRAGQLSSPAAGRTGCCGRQCRQGKGSCVHRMKTNKLKIDYSLYLVTDRFLAGIRSLEDIVREGIGGGVTVVQLREKDTGTRRFLDQALGSRE